MKTLRFFLCILFQLVIGAVLLSSCEKSNIPNYLMIPLQIEASDNSEIEFKDLEASIGGTNFGQKEVEETLCVWAHTGGTWNEGYYVFAADFFISKISVGNEIVPVLVSFQKVGPNIEVGYGGALKYSSGKIYLKEYTEKIATLAFDNVVFETKIANYTLNGYLTFPFGKSWGGSVK